MELQSNIMKLAPGLILTIGSLFFIMLLLISYFSKKRFASITNKLYRYLLVTVFILLITEIVSTSYFSVGTSKLLYLFFIRMHWYTGIMWFLLLYFYSICFLKNIDVKGIKDLVKKDSRCKKFLIFSIIATIGYLFIPFSNMEINNFIYLPGAAAYYILVYCAISVTSIVIFMITKAKEATIRKKVTTIIMVVEMIIIFVLQFLAPQISFLALGSALQMFFLYFSIENPDLLVINELEVVKGEIEKSSSAKSDFLSNMSHEIRSPMNAIVGFSESLLNDPNFDEENAKNDIKHIYSAGNNLLEIINNILDISKIESGKEDLEKKEYSIGNIIMELSSIIDARIDNRPIKFLVEVDKEIPSKLYGDSTKLFQILLNILTNAVKYTEVGKIKLTVDKVINEDNVTLRFKVSDTGYGIKKEDSGKLFEKFSRLDTATTNEIEGTGLGLVITKRYVDLMGGKIWFESEYGVGTTFYVDIDQRIIDKTAIGDINDISRNVNQIDYIDCSNYKIMIVDDNKLNLKVAKRLLSGYKFDIETISSGKECIYKVKEGTKYDMIFLDHMMPEMDGIEVVHILKKLDGYNIPPIVALTANAITGMREMYLSEGFDEYLSKPINVSELNKLINKYFGK